MKFNVKNKIVFFNEKKIKIVLYFTKNNVFIVYYTWFVVCLCVYIH